MQLEILLVLLIYGNNILCTLNNSYSQLRKINKEKDILRNVKRTLSLTPSQPPFNNGSQQVKGYNDFSKQHLKNKRRIKRLKSKNAIDLSDLAEHSIQFSENLPKRQPYLYNEIFSPWEYSHLLGNYFNAWYIPEGSEDMTDHNREKRYSQNLYRGNPESQFTSDVIDDFINLKTGEKKKIKLSALEKAFQELENDLTELARLKSRKLIHSKKNKRKLGLNKISELVGSEMPSNIEHVDRNISEEVVRVYVPKVKKSEPTSSPQFLKNESKSFSNIFGLFNKDSRTGVKRSVGKNEIKITSQKLKNAFVSFNNKVNKTNRIREDT